jgi:NAD(P)-dependent dehydrogenase (short-subunit alcohol dehydrogenase family)
VLGGGSLGPGWGIGRAVCAVFARAGARVVVADSNMQAAQETVDAIVADGGAAVARAVDVLDDAGLDALVRGVGAEYGRLDVLHCNVGLGKAGPSTNTSPADWRRIADANLTALHVATQAALPTMQAQGSGVVLVTSSIAAIRDVGYPHLAYGATKAAAIQFVRLFAREHAARGIRANTLVAGLIDTPRIAQTLAGSYGDRDLAALKAARAALPPLGRMGTGFDVAEAALFLASDRAAYITGTEVLIDGGLALTVREAPPG